MIASRTDIDLDVFDRYAGLSLPRHVAYPMPTWWHDLGADDMREMLARRGARETPNDLSLYVHVPFCEALCKFCACHRDIVPRDRADAPRRADAYVAALAREIELLGRAVGAPRRLRHVHWGGGTPTYLSVGRIADVQRAIRDAFDVTDDAEIAMEIDPRVVTTATLEALRDLGFTRLSMGIQDFDDAVQRHVRRIQPLSMVRACVDDCRRLGFDSVNFDLIYGMPYQTPDTIRRTVDETIKLGPDRIAYYHYAQIPEKIATQRGMDYTRLPDSRTKLEMFVIGLERFTAAGYAFIGLDHFARPDEGLARARSNGTLQRNFQGMTTGKELDLIGAGASAIGHLSGLGFMQNIKETDRYVATVQEGRLPVARGKPLTTDDVIRQVLINELYCDATVRPRAIEDRFGIVFADYFAREMDIMRELQRDALVDIEADGTVTVTCPLGRVLMRNVAAAFDAYLAPDAYRAGEIACFSANA